MYGSVEQAFVGRDEPKNGCEGGYKNGGCYEKQVFRRNNIEMLVKVS